MKQAKESREKKLVGRRNLPAQEEKMINYGALPKS